MNHQVLCSSRSKKIFWLGILVAYSLLAVVGSLLQLWPLDALLQAFQSSTRQEQPRNKNNETITPSNASPAKVTPPTEKITIFYNLFLQADPHIPFVQELVQEQLNLTNSQWHGDIYVTLIGRPLSLPGTHLLHQTNQGSKLITLRTLWDHCQNNKSNLFHSKVIYLHSKGSFHPSPENNLLRRFLTAGALLEECAHLPDTCNICSSRMSPLPHPHTSGNMWLVRCSYVQTLLEPYSFRKAMGRKNNAQIGSGRFAAKHWIHSHPTNRPCDLYTRPDYVWDYQNVPTVETFQANLELQPAPRFNNSEVYDLKKKWYGTAWDRLGGGQQQFRLDEYRRLYNVSAPHHCQVY
jgi:hypothetical protein